MRERSRIVNWVNAGGADTDKLSVLWHLRLVRSNSESSNMADDELYRFVINAYSPDTIPMSRLAEYMADLAILLGEKASVHFVRLEPSSTAMALKIEREAQPKVDARVRGVSYRQGPVEALTASARLDRRLQSDNADGYIKKPDGGKILEFPGVKRLVHTPYAPFWQTGHIDGFVVLVGNRPSRSSSAVGRSRSFVHLEGAVPFACWAPRLVAIQIREYLLTDTPVRCFGNGRWERGADGRWNLLEFEIERFKPLDTKPLSHVVDELRNVPGRWKDDDLSPLDLLRASKGEDEDDIDGEIQ